MRILARAMIVLGIAGCLNLTGATARAAFTDPSGDTFGTGRFKPDIITYSATFDTATATTSFTIGFANAIAAPSTNAVNGLYGYIDLDTDKNAATGGNAAFGADQPGGNSWINFFVAQGLAPGPAINLGDEYFVDLGSEHDHAGTVDLVDASTNAILAEVAISYTSTSLSLTLALLGTGDGSMNFGLVVGDSDSPSDRAANGAVADRSVTTSAAVPEPSSLLLSALGLAGCLGYRSRSR
jgi:hypothetical protein